MQLRTGADRWRHTLGFEVVGLLISIPVFSAISGQPVDHLGPLAFGISLLAAGLVDQIQSRILAPQPAGRA